MAGKSKTDHGLKKGQVIAATIESLAPGGQAVTREPGLPVFVDRAAPGDRVEIELFDVRKDFARARVVRVIEASPQRAEPPCKLFKVCGGCQWQHLDYPWQLKAKEDIVRQTVKHIGGLNPDLVMPITGAAEPLNYRNKVQFPVESPQGSTRILAGYYKQDSHDLVNIKHCPVQPEPLDRMLEAVKVVCEKHELPAYVETKRKGLLRHITARHSFYQNKVLVTLVVNASAGEGKRHEGHGKPAESVDLNAMQQIAREIMSAVPEVAGVCLNFNPHAGNKIMGETTLPLAGEPYIVERLKTYRADLPSRLQEGLDFRLSSTSFFQVNTTQACRLMELILDAVVREPSAFAGRAPLVVDAYAGVGAIALWLSQVASSVIAVEEHPAAVRDGMLNLELNRIDNVEFREGPVEDVFPDLLAGGLNPDVLVVDPPRKGLSPRSIESMLELAPLRIVYISCNPATLARDLKVLGINGYKTKQIQPVDLFPQTYHIESVSMLEK